MKSNYKIWILTAAAVLSFIIPTTAATRKQHVHYPTYRGLVMAGYQGWFGAEGDGGNRGWYHYSKRGKFYPGNCSIDFWPDVSEYKVTYDTPFKHENGKTAKLYSPEDYPTIDLHFSWMKEYGIDGVYMQRFVTEIKGKKSKAHFDKVLEHALAAAKKYDRAICIMYDLSGCKPKDLSIVLTDWHNLKNRLKLDNPEVNPTYLHENKKPMVAIWGVGFNDNRKYSVEDVEEIVSSMDDESILLGVPYYWRLKKSDTVKGEALNRLIKKVDAIMPWAVGRYNNKSYPRFKQQLADDIAWCKKNKIVYAPLVFPGFSWGNLKSDYDNYNQIPRLKGQFLWNQIAGAIDAGAEAIYVAMFDEVDEGTAIFKCLQEGETPLNGNLKFVGIDSDVPNDHYLWLVGQGAKWLRGQESFSQEMPKRE